MIRKLLRTLARRVRDELQPPRVPTVDGMTLVMAGAELKRLRALVISNRDEAVTQRDRLRTVLAEYKADAEQQERRAEKAEAQIAAVVKERDGAQHSLAMMHESFERKREEARSFERERDAAEAKGRALRLEVERALNVVGNLSDRYAARAGILRAALTAHDAAPGDERLLTVADLKPPPGVTAACIGRLHDRCRGIGCTCACHGDATGTGAGQ